MKLLTSSIIGFATATLLLAAPARAKDWETALSVTENERQLNPTATLNLRYFFEPLNHGSSTPWDEVEFEDRISVVSGQASYTSRTIRVNRLDGSDGQQTFELDRKTEGLQGNFTYRDSDSPHSFSTTFAYQRFSGDSLNEFAPWVYAGSELFNPIMVHRDYSIEEFGFDYYNIAARYEYYLNRLWTAGAGISYVEQGHVPTLHLGTTRHWVLGGGRWFRLDAEGNLSRLKQFRFDPNVSGGLASNRYESWGLGVTGRYYFNVRTSVEAGAAFDDQLDTMTYRIGLAHYFNDTLFLRLHASESRIDEAYVSPFYDDSTTFRLTFGGRY